MTSSGHETGAYLTQQKPFLLINEKFVTILPYEDIFETQVFWSLKPSQSF